MSETGLRARLEIRARKAKAESLVLFYAARHSDTPWVARLLVALAVTYALSPIDLIPDFVPVLGLMDDLVLVPLLLTLALRLVPAPVLEECRKKAAAVPPSASKFASVMIIMIWIGFACLLGLWAYASLAEE